MTQIQFGLNVPISNPGLPQQEFLSGLRTALD